jgi:lysophospholipase
MTDVFFEIPGNPPPAKAQGGYFEGDRGVKLRYGVFGATGRPMRGSIVIFTGRNEAIEKYFETIADLSKRGFGVAIMEWRGQAGSGRMLKDPQRGYVEKFSNYLADIDRFFTDIVLPDCRGPYYVLAHSTGALAALSAVPSLINRVRRMVLIAPLLGSDSMPFSLKTTRRLTGMLRLLGLGRVYASGGPWTPTPFAENVLTSDKARYARNTLLYKTYPQLSLGSPTVSWINAVATASEKVRDPDFCAKVHMPILFVAAGADTVVSTRDIEHYARRLRSASIVTIDGAKHEILQENDFYREQFFAAFDAFIPGSSAEALAATA